MPRADYDLSPFGKQRFGSAELGHVWRTESLIDLANRLVKHPKGSLPQKFHDPKTLRRCYDLMNTKTVTHAAVLRPAAVHTADKILDHKGVVLDLHDTTEVDLTTHRSLHSELGQLGNGTGKGYLCHNSLAVLPGRQGVLGLLAQQLHVRADVPPKETPAERRERENRESLLWLWGVRDAQEALEQALEQRGLDRLPEGLLIVDVCDRAGDSYEFLDYEDLHDRHFVVRSNQDRTMLPGHQGQAEPQALFGYLRTLPARGRRQIVVHGRAGQPDREATVALSWAAVRIVSPRQQRGHFRKGVLLVWAVRVWEPAPAPGVEPVEWFLLTNVAVTVRTQAWERVDWYCNRWVVEELHKGQKTGCDIEDPQFTTAQALQPMIALLSVVAAALLDLRDRSRDPKLAARPAAEVVDEELVAVLSGWRYRQRRPLTVREFFLALARLGGHQGRKGDGPPGWLVLWRGWQALQLMVEGARAAARPGTGGPPGAGPPEEHKNGGQCR